ncbi:ABC transporter substrate-binding protein [Thermodesulfobacteriota bacterium]
MGNYRRKRLTLLVVIGVIGFLVISGAKDAEARDFKGTLKIAEIGVLSGRGVKGGVPVHNGLIHYVRYINEEKGGIAGYKLEVESFDGKLDPALMIPASKRYSDELKVKFIYNVMATFFSGLIDIAQEKKCVVMSMSGTQKQAILSKEEEAAGKENYFFSHTPIIASRMATAMDIIKKDWATKQKKGSPKVAGFNWDNVTGRTADKAARFYAKRAGFEWVGSTYHETQIMDAVSQVANLKRWGADYIVGSYTNAAAITVFVKEMARMKYHATVLHHNELATAYLETHDPAFEGHMAYAYTATWKDTNVPEIALMHKLNKKWFGNAPDRIPYYVAGWHAAKVFSEGLRIGVERFGADNLTGPNVKEAFESIKNMDMNGLSSPMTYNRWDHQGSHGLQWLKCEGGKLVPVSGFVDSPPLTDEQRSSKFWK